MNDELLRLKALVLIQIADNAALLAILGKLDPDADRKFLELRKQILHASLESYETTDPAFAAILQATIDRHTTHFPFDY